MSEENKIPIAWDVTTPIAWKVIQDTEKGPVVWGTFDTEEELLKFMKYMLRSCSAGALVDAFRVREIYASHKDEGFMAYAAFLGLGDGKGVKE
ncbi:MAG: hypothetical protein IKM86_04715 [Acidaminococcaceae bacterium]|nr:hypothetical protein [Acidaminococcaceae bacterium]